MEEINNKIFLKVPFALILKKYRKNAFNGLILMKKRFKISKKRFLRVDFE